MVFTDKINAIKVLRNAATQPVILEVRQEGSEIRVVAAPLSYMPLKSAKDIIEAAMELGVKYFLESPGYYGYMVDPVEEFLCKQLLQRRNERLNPNRL